MPAKPARGGKWEPRFHPGVFVGMLNSSSEAVVVTEQGLAIKTMSANIRRVPESERWDADRNTRNAGHSMVQGCPGWWYLRTGQGRQQAHSEACRKRIEGLLKGDSVGAARLAAASERINRALADAVERHATKDPGVRGILKRASVVCHPESESQKKIAMDTEQDPSKKKDKDHIEFLCELYEAQAAQGRYFVHELASEVNSIMRCMAKIMAMPGTRAAAADLCMFGLAACDEGGPGLVNASVRTITNARQVRVR